MTKDDKQFFIGLIKGLERKFDGLEVKFDGLEARFDSFEGRFDSLEERFDSLDNKVGSLETKVDLLDNKVGSLGKKVNSLDNKVDSLEGKVEENSRDIRYNGLLIEKMQDDLMFVKEGDVSVMMLHEKVDYILDEIQDLPSIRHVVKKHSKQLALLDSKNK